MRLPVVLFMMNRFRAAGLVLGMPTIASSRPRSRICCQLPAQWQLPTNKSQHACCTESLRANASRACFQRHVAFDELARRRGELDMLLWAVDPSAKMVRSLQQGNLCFRSQPIRRRQSRQATTDDGDMLRRHRGWSDCAESMWNAELGIVSRLVEARADGGIGLFIP